MLALKGMVTEGKPIIPEAEASTLAEGVGVLPGSLWVMAAIAGFPAHLLVYSMDPISVGRVVSACLGILALVQIFYLLASFKVDRIVSLFFILSLVVSEIFLLSCHSARLDILVANYLLLILQLYHRKVSPVLLGGLVGSSIFVYPHAVSLLIIPSALICIYFLRSRANVHLAKFAFSAIGVLVLACFVYFMLTGHFGILGPPTGRKTQYTGVVGSIPLMKLFSWSVQKVSFFGRLEMWLDNAWPMLFGIIAAIFYNGGKKNADENLDRSLLIGSFIVLSTFIFQGPALFYAIYVLPILGILVVITLSRKLSFSLQSRFSVWFFVIGGIAMAAFHINHLEAHAKAELPAFVNNRAAVKALIAPIRSKEHPPKVLAEIATLQYLMDQKDVRLMTHHFLWLATSDRTPVQVLRDSHVDYILRYSNSPIVTPDLLQDFKPIAERTGQFLENSYKNANPNCDTLRLYRRIN